MDDSNRSKQPGGESNGETASAMRPLLWVLLPLAGVILWQLFAGS